MAAIGETIAKINPYNPVHAKLKIDGGNYLEWVSKMRDLFRYVRVDGAVPSAFVGMPGDKIIPSVTGEVTNAEPPSTDPSGSPMVVIETSTRGKKKDQLEHAKITALLMIKTHLDVGVRDWAEDQTDPEELWKNLHTRFTTVVQQTRSRVRRRWVNFGLDKCKSIDEYEIELEKLVRKMKLCGYAMDVTEEEQVAKTLNTMGIGLSALRSVLQRQEFKTMTPLIAALREVQVSDDIAQQREAERLAQEKYHVTEQTEVHHIEDKVKTAPLRVIQRKPGKEQRFKGKGFGKPYPKAVPRRGDKDKGQKIRKARCFKCGNEGHLIRNCDASFEEISKFHGQKPTSGASNAISIAFEPKRTSATSFLSDTFEVNAITKVQEHLDNMDIDPVSLKKDGSKKRV